MRQRWASFLATLAVLGGLVVLGAPSASATETADWMPFKGVYGNAVGCTWNNGCGGGYHGGASEAIDFIVPTGTPVYAAGSGTVQSWGGCHATNSPGCNGSAGNYIVISHSDGRQSRYLHLSSIHKASGSVARGSLIGYSGNSGGSPVPHLHYDEMVGGVKVDPGPMKARHGNSLVQYPNVLGYSGWSAVPAWSNHTVRNDSFLTPLPPTWNGVGGATFDGSHTLEAGHQLFGGHYLLSENGQYALLMQSDGNLVLYRGVGVVWKSNTSGNPGARLVMQFDGNLVLYRQNGAPLWNTETNNVARFVVQSDGNLVARTANGGAAWASNTAVGPAYTYVGASELTSGQQLTAGQYIRSSDKRYTMLMQTDGNLVMYGPGYHVLWHTGTGGKPGAYLVVQLDGNVVLYRSDGVPLWNTETNDAVRIGIQSDGNIVARDASGGDVWNAGTVGQI